MWSDQVSVNRRNVLLVSYHFPPFGGSGVQRALKLARYLPDNGWDVHVLCADHRRYPLMDESLLGEIDPQVRVHRVAGLEPASLAGRLVGRSARTTLQDRIAWRLERWAKWLPLGEPELLWLPSASAKAASLMERHRFDAVVTTSPPHAVHLVGDLLQSNFGLPWVADLRDPIVDNFAYEATGIAHRIFRIIERRVASADQVVTTCPEYADRFRDSYPASSDRVGVLTNGYDAADTPKIQSRNNPQTLTLTYVGAFYRQQSIEPGLAAIRALRASSPEFAKAFRFRLVGSVAASQRPLIQAGDSDFMSEAGYLPHHQAIAEMARADALLLMTPPNEGGRLCIPAKTFEYLAFGRHVVAAVHPDTWLAGMLKAAGNVTLTSPDETGLRRALASVFDSWKSGKLQSPRDMSQVIRFSRDKLAAGYAAILDAQANTRSIGRCTARELVA